MSSEITVELSVDCWNCGATLKSTCNGTSVSVDPCTVCMEEEFKVGEEIGFDNGKDAGYDRGWSDGESKGYDDGYNDGLKESIMDGDEDIICR